MLLSPQFFATLLVMLLSMSGICLIQFPRLQKLLINKTSVSSESLEKDIKAENLRLTLLKEMPSFSYDNFISDWVYIDFLQYFGDNDARDKTGYSLSPEYFEVILKRDPKFLEAYLGLSISTSLYAAMPDRSIALMEKGLKSLSPNLPNKYYYVWRYKGTDELLFLGNVQAAQQSFIKAAEWADHFSDEESSQVAFVSRKTAEFLSKNPDSKLARIATWAMVLDNKLDDKTRKRAIMEIESLGGQVITNPDGKYMIKHPKKD